MFESLRKIFLTVVLLSPFYIWSQTNVLSGTILDSKNNKPLEFVSIVIEEQNAWAISNSKGFFTITKIPPGCYHLHVSSLGYAKQRIPINISSAKTELNIFLKQDNLSLEEVVVTAERDNKDHGSGYTINKKALNHLQLINVQDITSLLPGQQSGNSNLTSASYISLRSQNNETNVKSSFGTAIEVDGVRLNNNHSFAKDVYGVDLRSISTTNIESVEVITGIPSAEEGDLESGIVKVKTKKGKSPLSINLSTNIHTKQVAINKGFQTMQNGAIINTSFEHAKSVSNIMSPYTSYQRNALSLNFSKRYKNSFSNQVLLELGLTGNMGGLNSEADPDAFLDTYKKEKDHSIRTYTRVKYLVNHPWLTNLDLNISFSYKDNLKTNNKRVSSSSSVAAIHHKNTGYFVGEKLENNPYAPVSLIEPGYWYEKSYIDNKSTDFRLKLKADLVKNISKLHTYSKVGLHFSRTNNHGKGKYYEDLIYTPTWRSYPYNQVPAMNNLAIFIEEKLRLKFNANKQLELSAGIRADNTWIKYSVYGLVNSISPRTNLKFTQNLEKGFINKLAIYAGWGQTVKLPSFQIIHPTPSYTDRLAFAPGTMSDGTVYYAYYSQPSKAVYNPNLKWQKSDLIEVGVNLNTNIFSLAANAYFRKSSRQYTQENVFTPYTYKFTSQKSLESSVISEGNRRYSIDPNSGIVTVSDITGKYNSHILDYEVKESFLSNYTYKNGSPVYNYGLEWNLNFRKIEKLYTSIQIDGRYSLHKRIDETLNPYKTTQSMNDGSPHKYIGYYIGKRNIANGIFTKQLRSNITISTHIPKIRLIVSLRIETSLFRSEQNLSEYKGEQLAFAISDRSDFLPSEDNTDIYRGENYTAMYPEYYSSYDDMTNLIPFKEKFLWAYQNDKDLYNELAKMVKKNTFLNYFGENRTSAFYSANIDITKEIGDYASISFHAKNFTNNMGAVKQSRYQSQSSLYDSGNIPALYYGLTLRIKL